MSADRIQMSVDAQPDPHAAPPAGAKDTAHGVSITPPDPNATPAPKDERPKWLPEKFNSGEDLAAAYVAAQKKISEMGQLTKPDASQPTDNAAAAAAVSQAGLDTKALAKELSEKGQLSPESLKALNDKGISKEIADAYVAGLKAQHAQLRSSLAEVAGGEDGLKNVYEWARTNMTQEEIAAYDAVLDTGNMGAAKLALQGIVGRFTAATGKEPATVDGDTVTAAGDAPPFNSNAEVVAAMGDPKYSTDENYRQHVKNRLRKSTSFGVRV